MTTEEMPPQREIGRVEMTGPHTLIVDGGRTGWAHLAVTRSGAYDRRAYQRANRLVGNPPGAAALEILLGPARLRFDTAATVALTGVQAALAIDISGTARAVDCESTLTLPAGCALDIPRFHQGLRGYLAIRGGWAATPTLGSRSSDTLSGMGPSPVRPGDPVTVYTSAARFPQHDANVVAFRARAHNDGPLPLRLLPGPRTSRHLHLHEWLLRHPWLISSDSDRIGVRLAPSRADIPVPTASAPTPVPSEPLVRGAVQVPPDGHPVVMGPDHPTTGGYPVVGVLTAHDSDALAQLRPGEAVQFVDIRL